MNASFLRLIITLLFFYFFLSINGPGQKPLFPQDSSSNDIQNKNANYLKDTTLLKKDTLKKTVPAAAADSNAPTPSHWELNVVYESNDVNNGRKDSTVIPLITPKVSYIFKSGFEIDLGCRV